MENLKILLNDNRIFNIKIKKLLAIVLVILVHYRLQAQVELKPYIKKKSGEISYFEEVKFGDYNFIGYKGGNTTKVSRNDVSSATVSKGSLKNKGENKDTIPSNQILRRKFKKTGKMQYDVSPGKTTIVVIMATNKAILGGRSSAGNEGFGADMFYLIEGNKATLLRFRKEEHYNKLIETFKMDSEVLNQFKLLYEEKGVATRMYTYLSILHALYMSKYYIEL